MAGGRDPDRRLRLRPSCRGAPPGHRASQNRDAVLRLGARPDGGFVVEINSTPELFSGMSARSINEKKFSSGGVGRRCLDCKIPGSVINCNSIFYNSIC